MHMSTLYCLLQGGDVYVVAETASASYVIASVCCGVHLPLPVITVNPLTAARGLYTGRSEPIPLVIDARLLMLQR